MLNGGSMVISEKLQTKILDILHEGHPGLTAMKALMRFYVWWPSV